MPLVILWIPPIIGFLPPILAVIAPRQVMSRHFHNVYEINWYAQIEYRQRREAYMELGELFWSMILVNVKKSSLIYEAEDAAGPIFDGMILYSAFADHHDHPASDIHLPKGIFSSVDDLPREYLVSTGSNKRSGGEKISLKFLTECWFFFGLVLECGNVLTCIR